MNEKHVLDVLKQDIVIPEVVQNKADEAFASIRREAGGARSSADEAFAGIRREAGGARSSADEAFAGIRREAGKVSGSADHTADGEEQRMRGSRGTMGLWRMKYRRAAVVGLAAALVLGTVTAGAAVYLKWSGFEKEFRVTPEQKSAAETSGLADFPELSVTDEGVTVTAWQSIVDNYYAYLSFKVEGYEVPEGIQPEFDYVCVTVDGEDVGFGRGFYNGLIMGEDGTAQRADGQEIPVDQDGSLIMDYSQEDGSLEYRIILTSDGETGRFVDKPIHVEFSDLGSYPNEAENPEQVQGEVAGSWAFDWTLKGDDSTWTAQCEEAIGDTGATVTQVELSPISMKVVLTFPRQEITETGLRESQVMVDGELKQVSEPFEYTMYVEAPALMGVKLEDGTLLPRLCLGAGRYGYVDEQSDQYEQLFATNRILDVNQVKSLLFLKEAPEGEGGILTEENLYVVDIR